LGLADRLVFDEGALRAPGDDEGALRAPGGAVAFGLAATGLAFGSAARLAG
jgi:hypothetical protein